MPKYVVSGRYHIPTGTPGELVHNSSPYRRDQAGSLEAAKKLFGYLVDEALSTGFSKVVSVTPYDELPRVHVLESNRVVLEGTRVELRIDEVP